MTKWQPIDTAPKDGTKILGYDDEDFYMCWYDGDIESWENTFDNYVNPTHWIPLPKPPLKKHQCGGEFECYCDEDGNMYLQVYNQHGRCSILKVSYCPYCGDKA